MINLQIVQDYHDNKILAEYFRNDYLYHTITEEQYTEFKHYYVIDVLKGKRYGQAFCDRFNIPNGSPLYYFKSQEICDRWIRDNYLVKNEKEIH
jgi:hypothetical protein